MELFAYAKINLSLAVIGKREDGYHELDGVMQSISLCDRISIEKAEKLSLDCSDSDLCGEKNIAYKAAELFFKATGINSGADIYIEKRIPSPSGLGGGSADAATVLLTLNELYGTNLSYSELSDIAVKLGADVPFFLRGGTQRARGIGEKLEPLRTLDKGYFVIAINGKKPSTGAMYAKIDSCTHPAPDIEANVRAVISGNLNDIASTCDNSFKYVTGLYSVDTALKSTPALKIALSGSGPAVFAVYENEKDAQNAAKILETMNMECYICTPIGEW